MLYTEEIKDLFTVSEEYYLAHCISADFGMGAGIVVEFNKRYDMKNKLRMLYPDYLQKWCKNNMDGDCILEGRVLNLITKERCNHKPTYQSMQTALDIMKETCLKHYIKKIAVPLLGCGIDLLEWRKVSELIQKTFQDTDIEILVCKQQP